MLPHSWQYLLERNILAGIFFGVVFARITTFQTSKLYFSQALWIKALPATILTFVTIFVGHGLFKQ